MVGALQKARCVRVFGLLAAARGDAKIDVDDLTQGLAAVYGPHRFAGIFILCGSSRLAGRHQLTNAWLTRATHGVEQSTQWLCAT